MTVGHFNHTADLHHDHAHGLGLGALVTAVTESVRGWWHRRQVLAELESLDDAMLADIGITRGDFRAIVDGTWRRD